MILDIFSLIMGASAVVLLIVATVLTIVHDENPDHVYDEELA